jgi:serine/threonine protein phosphatase PrpC
MTSILTRQISIGFSSKAALQGVTTLHKSWPLPCVSAGGAVTLGRDAIIVLLLESAEPLPLGSSLLVQVYEAVRKRLGRDPIELSKAKERMERAIQDANELALRELANTSGAPPRISLMLAAFLLAGDASCDVMIGHVGACRAFLRRHHHILPLTTPHTWGQENAASGIISAGDEENESKYPYWRRPTRWLGAAQKVAVDFTLEDATADCVKLQRDDSIFLCSSRLTATSLEKERDRIDARSVSALAQQLTERAALPGGNGAAAVAVGWSSKLGLIPIIAAIIILVLLAIVAATVSPTGGVDPTEVASKASQKDTNGSPEPSPPATDTPAPTAGASSTPMPTPPSPPPPLTIAAAPTRTAQPTRAPTATPAPTTTPIPTPTRQPTSTPTTASTVTSPPLQTPDATQLITAPVTLAPVLRVTLLEPSHGETIPIDLKNKMFSWSALPALPDGYQYELVFWQPNQNGRDVGQSPKGATSSTFQEVDFPTPLTNIVRPGSEFCWGVRLWNAENGVTAMLSECRLLKIKPDAPPRVAGFVQ